MRKYVVFGIWFYCWIFDYIVVVIIGVWFVNDGVIIFCYVGGERRYEVLFIFKVL